MLSYLTCLDHQKLRKYLCELLPSARGICRMSHRWDQGALNDSRIQRWATISWHKNVQCSWFSQTWTQVFKELCILTILGVHATTSTPTPSSQSTQWWSSHKWLESDSIEASTCFRQGRQFLEIRAGGILFPCFPSPCVVMRNALAGQKPQRSASHRGWSDWSCLPQCSERMGGGKARTGHRRD